MYMLIVLLFFYFLKFKFFKDVVQDTFKEGI